MSSVSDGDKCGVCSGKVTYHNFSAVGEYPYCESTSSYPWKCQFCGNMWHTSTTPFSGTTIRCGNCGQNT